MFDLQGHLMLIGDVHGVHPQLHRATMSAHARGIRNIVQLGDFGAFAGHSWEQYLDLTQKYFGNWDMMLYVLRGNHDDPFLLNSYPEDPDRPGARILRDNIRFLTDNTQFTWEGYTVTIEGGAYSVDRKYRTVNVDYWEEEVITDAQVQKALTLPPTDILLCHDSPAGAPNPVTDNPGRQAEGIMYFGESAIASATQHRLILQKITEHLQPSYIAHGHYHRWGSGVYNLSTGKETRVLSLDEGGGHWNHFVHILDPSEERPW